MRRTLSVMVLLAALGGAAAMSQPDPAAGGRSQPMPPHHDEALQDALEQVVRGFRGGVGIYVRHLGTGQQAAIQADSLFPTASLIKVPILLTTFARIEEGALAYDQPLVFRDSIRLGSPEAEDILAWYQDGAEIDLSEVVLLMLTVSDNTASLWLQQLVGEAAPEDDNVWRRWGRGGMAINDWLAARGFEATRVNSGVPGRREAYERYGWGQTTPAEMAEMLVRIRRGEAVSTAASATMYRALTRSYWDDGALSQIPPTVQAASKQGWVDQSRSEVVLVNAPHGDYVFCVLTKDQQDESGRPDNEGDVLIREVSRTLWATFEPESDWPSR